MTWYYIFINGEFYAYMTEKHFHNSMFYWNYILDDCFKVYSIVTPD